MHKDLSVGCNTLLDELNALSELSLQVFLLTVLYLNDFVNELAWEKGRMTLGDCQYVSNAVFLEDFLGRGTHDVAQVQVF